MRRGQTKGLLLFCTINIIFTGCVAGDDVIMSDPVRARLGQSASLSCTVKGEVQTVLSVWSRCNDSSTIAVFHPKSPGEHSSSISEPYTGLVSITEYHTLTITRVQDGDFGEYCCTLTTFPSGSLKGRVLLLRDEEEKENVSKQEEEIVGEQEEEIVGKPQSPPADLPAMIVYITCGVVAFVILTGIITMLLCMKKRRKVRNPVHVTVSRASLSPKQPSLLQKDSRTPSHTHRRDDEDGEDDLYLNMKNSKT
ncbi:nectin-3-like [Neoarius graeffei]|uniref:nectin-3-like n=1 Tax=Neoarius graeffei TaxID=443677 RepID=UPI00298D21DD|nr:nectin-3-like [Neoarius graeffei]